MLDESMPDTTVTEHTHDISEVDESRSLDVSDYVQLLENPDFVGPEQRREELETEVPEIEDDDILEQEPMAMPDELFTANDTDICAEMFQLQLIIYFLTVMRINRAIAMPCSQLWKIFCWLLPLP